MRFHCISGLPRSGSTLLAAILRQNPRFHADITSPVMGLMESLLKQMSADSEYCSFYSDTSRMRILKGVIRSYYDDGREVVFDTNRVWTGKLDLLTNLFPEAKVICCVRDVWEILNSIERLLRKNPYQPSSLFRFNPGMSVYSRTDALMNRENGFVGSPWAQLRGAWYGPQADRLIMVEYNDLATRPQETIERIYLELGEEFFPHDFDHVSYENEEFDASCGMPGLHRVSGKVTPVKYPNTIPPDLILSYHGSDFWRREPRWQTEPLLSQVEQ